MRNKKLYVGVHQDIHGGMTPIGKIIRDAWVFGLIPTEETCEGWDYARINHLIEKVNTEWDKYGCMVSNLPEPLYSRHHEIHQQAIKIARSHGWNGEYELLDED